MPSTQVTDPDWFTDAVAQGVLVTREDGWADDGDAYTLAGVARPVPTDAPVVTAVAPATAAVIDAPLDVIVTGTGFTRECRVVFGGATPPTSFHSDTELQVRVDPADWSAGVVQVGVGFSDRGPSDTVPFTFT